MYKKWMLVLGLLVIAGMLLASCGGTTDVTDEPEPVPTDEPEPEPEPTDDPEPEPEPTDDDVAPVPDDFDVYRVGIFEDPVSLNYWNYLGPGSSVWTAYVLGGYAANLYTLSDQRYDFVPSLAAELVEPTQEGDLYVMEVPMVTDATWSDGETIDANDVCFTHNACRDLQLTQNWPNNCAPLGATVTCEVVDDFTVKYTFDVVPSLGVWNAGVALAPILPEHYWADVVATSYGFVEGLEAPEADCGSEELSEDEQAACDTYAEAFENARKTLYEADPTGSPVFGGYVTDRMEMGAFVQRTMNPDYYFAGAEVVEYDDGTWMLEHTNGTTYQLYGDAAGEETLRFTQGPYAPNIVLSIYGSQDAAFLALADGEIDYVINPLGLSRGLQEQAQRGEGIQSYSNADYGLFYIAFNMRKYPMSEYEFRQALDIVIDKEFVVNSVLAGVVYPMYSTMPPGNAFWHNPDVPTPYIGLSREERVNMAVQVLSDAGWTWEEEPFWDADRQDVTNGVGITMPNGEPMQEVTILGPGPAYDPIRATFNQWISEWARELGMPVESELTGFNTILGPVFIESNFDMYILGWSLGNVAFPDYYESFWHSRNDTAVSGNYNTPGLNDAEYDAMVDEFMTTTDLNRARELVFEMQVVLADLRPYIPLFYKQVTDLIRDNIELPYTELLGGLESAAGFQTDAQPLFR